MPYQKPVPYHLAILHTASEFWTVRGGRGKGSRAGCARAVQERGNIASKQQGSLGPTTTSSDSHRKKG